MAMGRARRRDDRRGDLEVVETDLGPIPHRLAHLGAVEVEADQRFTANRRA